MLVPVTGPGCATGSVNDPLVGTGEGRGSVIPTEPLVGTGEGRGSDIPTEPRVGTAETTGSNIPTDPGVGSVVTTKLSFGWSVGLWNCVSEGTLVTVGSIKGAVDAATAEVGTWVTLCSIAFSPCDLEDKSWGLADRSPRTTVKIIASTTPSINKPPQQSRTLACRQYVGLGAVSTPGVFDVACS